MRFIVTEEEAGARLDKLIARKVPGLGRAGAKQLFSEGKVRVGEAGGRARRASKGDVAARDAVVEIELAETTDRATPDPDIQLEIALETAGVVVVEKPAGLATAPLAPGERGTLANALVARYPEMAELGFSPREPGLCHRLDTGTSGLIVAARTRRAFDVLTVALKEGRLDKRYLVICAARDMPESGTIEIPIAPHPKDRRRVYACVHPRDVARYAPRPASTAYRVLRLHGDWALVEARAPKATRHQIRVHFAAMGHPLAGDVLYGGLPVAERSNGHALHASHIVWRGDASVPAFEVDSALPADLEAFLQRAGGAEGQKL
jgi:23S rRNA pseudouridine1911/1915/1917 synthase